MDQMDQMNQMVSPQAGEAAERRRPSIIERAFELARTRSCLTVAEIGVRLKQERYDAVEAHLSGQSIRRDLRRACAEAAAETQAAAAKA